MSVDGRVHVLVCEDSPTYAAHLRRALEHGGDIAVVGVCETAEEALAGVRELRPQLVTMDLELPGLSGLQAVEQIMAVQPLPVLVLSAHVGPRTDRAAAALAAGALDAIAKRDLELRDPSAAPARRLRERVRVLARARVIRHPRARLPQPGAAASRPALAVGVCASTGGPQSVVTILRALPGAYRVPLLLVQHIASGFTEGLVRWLDANVALDVRAAENGVPLEPGVTVAPEGTHLAVSADGRLQLDGRSVSGHHRPSGDVLLRSLAEAAGDEAVAVVLTGMGKDGAAGVAAVRAAGGLTMAQDEASSAVYGMPRAALESGAEHVLPPAGIAERLAALFPSRRLG